MVTIYAPNAQDFSTLGLGALAPYECTVEEQAGGMYELTMSHPMDEAGKWLNIGVGCIVKAPRCVSETGRAQRHFRVQRRAGHRLALEGLSALGPLYRRGLHTGL